MKKWHLVLAVMLLVSDVGHAQGGQRGGGGQAQARGGGGDQRTVQSTADLQVVDGWGRPAKSIPFDRNPGPAPVHDISGIWEPANGAGAGIQANGPVSMPSDG